MAALALPLARDVLAYARQCEGPPYGFNITPWAVSSSLQTQHASIRVLRHFGAGPRDAALIRELVASCQTGLGGFGRVPGAIPRLDDSLRALGILSMLSPGASPPSDTRGGQTTRQATDAGRDDG